MRTGIKKTAAIAVLALSIMALGGNDARAAERGARFAPRSGGTTVDVVPQLGIWRIRVLFRLLVTVEEDARIHGLRVRSEPSTRLERQSGFRLRLAGDPGGLR